MFKSRYINDNGKWTQNAVNEGFVEFNDYISDIKNTSNEYRSFNNKPLKFSSADNIYNSISNSSNNNLNVNDYKLDFKEAPTSFSNISEYKDNVTTKINTLRYTAERSKWAIENIGLSNALQAYNLSNEAGNEAVQIAKDFGLNTTWNNVADAYRHFAWNAKMTRDSKIGYYPARNVTNRYEYEEMLDKNWISEDSEGFDYLKDNTIISGKMNQEMFMDLWNNQVGRELANNANFKDKNIQELFDMAYENNWLITDANTAYDYLGIKDYVTDFNDYTVNVDWNLTTGNITVYGDKDYISLQIGI